MSIYNAEKAWIVFISSFPPRECGIATFTADLVEYFDRQFVPREETKVIAMNTDDQIQSTPAYSDKVIFQISENNREEYSDVAKKLNEMPHVKLVSIQHEFGIFGQNDGENVLIFIEEVKKPIVVTFHTVLPHPSENQKRIVCEIVKKAEGVVVMTHSSRELLESVYGANPEKIKMIAHGIHPVPYATSEKAKTEFGFEGRTVLSTFGLLNRGKGIEFAIEALPKIVEQYPDVLYAVIGTTHPVVLRREGPVYLNELREQVRRLGMERNVRFIDKYVETEELLRMLQATDIYMSLSQNPDQAVSGTLTYALGSGRPVVSTPFAQARELLTPELGLLAEFNNSSSIAERVLELLRDSSRLSLMSRSAYFRTRSMTWNNVTLSYMREFKRISPELASKGKSVPPIKLDHIKRMTDDFGIFQFAILTDPDPNSGYTIDDNARGMIVACWYAELLKDSSLYALADTYLKFVEHAAYQDEEGFKNYFTVKHEQNDSRNRTENLEDANARTLWSLACVAVSGAPVEMQNRARDLFLKQISFSGAVSSPRSIAFRIKAIAAWLLKYQDDEKMIARLVAYADVLVDLYKRSSSEDWKWFEEQLTYSNAVLPEALLFAFRITKRDEYITIATESLDFLIENSFNGEICVPVGQSGWYKRGGVKQLYDQQPEEVSALVLALQTMHEMTGDKRYLAKKEQTFDWFLGNNILEQVVYSQMSGGCYDGVGEGYINLNQGAESTISYLLARVFMG